MMKLLFARFFLLSQTLLLSNHATINASPVIVIDVPPVVVTSSDEQVVLSSALYSHVSISGEIDNANDVVTISVTEGTLTLTTTDGLDFVSGSGNGESFAFKGTSIAANNAMNGMIYIPGPSFAGRSTVSIEITGTQTVTKSFHIAVNEPIDAEQARDQLLSGVTDIHSGQHPGYFAMYGPTAHDIVLYPGDNDGAMIGVATLGRGRVIAMPDHQMLNMGAYGEDSGTFYINGIEWLTQSTATDVKILAYDAGSANWLTDQGYSNVLITEESKLINDLQSFGPDVFVSSWMGSNESEETIEAIKDFIANGGGLFIAEYGQGYEDMWWTHRDFHEAPGNMLLREAGIGFGDGFEWKTGTIDATNRATGMQITGDIVVDMLLNPATYTEQQKKRGAFSLQQLFEALPPGDPLLARLDAAFNDQIGSISVTPSNPLEDSFKQGLMKREGALLFSQPVDEVTVHRDAAAIYGEVPASAQRVTKSVDIDTSRARWHPTGLSAAAGEVVTLNIPEALVGQGFKIRINVHTDDISVRDSWVRPPIVHRWFEIDATEVRVASAFGGPIFIDLGGREFDDPAPNLGIHQIQISNAVEHPYFVLGQHTDSEWISSLRDKPDPTAVFVCRDLIFVQPASMSVDLTQPTALMEWWQQVLTLQDEMAAHLPGARQSPELVNIDVQISYGAAHAGFPIQAWDRYWDSLANYDSLITEGSWGDFHELGHEHQRGWWTFDDDTEVTVNIFSTYCLEKLTPNSNNGWKWTLDPKQTMIRAIEAIGSGTSYGDFEEYRFPFWRQLIDGFGFDKMQEVFKTYEDDNVNDASRLPETSTEEKDQWLIRFSETVGYDMTEFMVDAWKLEVSAEALSHVAGLGLDPWMPALGGIEGTFSTSHNTPISFDLRGEALSLDGVVQITVTNNEVDHSLVSNGDGTYTYTPPIGFVGTQSLSYSVISSSGHTTVHTLEVDVVEVLVVSLSANPNGVNGYYYPSTNDQIAGRAIWDREDGGRFIFYCQSSDKWMFTYGGYRQALIDNPSCGNIFKSESGDGQAYEPWEYDWRESGAIQFLGAPASDDEPSSSPSASPSAVPSSAPSSSPTLAPSQAPSAVPSSAPSSSPTLAPSQAPSAVPSSAPSSSPTLTASQSPSANPSVSPTSAPSLRPSSAPTPSPVNTPSNGPWEPIFTETFSQGTWGDSVFAGGDGGSDAIITTKGPSYVGDFTLRLRDNSSSSMATTTTISVSSYDDVKLSFRFQTRNVVAGEAFVVRYRTSLSSSWIEERFEMGTAQWPANTAWYLATLPVADVVGASDIEFQFQTYFDANRQKLHLDQIVLEGRNTII